MTKQNIIFSLNTHTYLGIQMLRNDIKNNITIPKYKTQIQSILNFDIPIY